MALKLGFATHTQSSQHTPAPGPIAGNCGYYRCLGWTTELQPGSFFAGNSRKKRRNRLYPRTIAFFLDGVVGLPLTWHIPDDFANPKPLRSKSKVEINYAHVENGLKCQKWIVSAGVHYTNRVSSDPPGHSVMRLSPLSLPGRARWQDDLDLIYVLPRLF